MPLSRKQAWDHLCNWTQSESLRKHARAVELVMRQAAYRYGSGAPEEEKWGITGLLHDADYEQWPQEHPARIVAWLEQQQENEIANAVFAHCARSDVPPQNILDKCLIAFDELTGFVIACCLVRPDGIYTLTAESVRKKLKDRAFAAKVDRQLITTGADLLKADFLQHMILIMKKGTT